MRMTRGLLSLAMWCFSMLPASCGSPGPVVFAPVRSSPLLGAPALQSTAARSGSVLRPGCFDLSVVRHRCCNAADGVRRASLHRSSRPPSHLSGAAGSEPGGSEVRAFLQKLKRADLQSLAKENNIPANKKSSEIIEQLIEARDPGALLRRAEPSVGEGSSDVVMSRVENDVDNAIVEEGDGMEESKEDGFEEACDEAEIGEAAIELSSQLGGLGAVVVFPTHGDFELELPVMAAEFGAQKNFIRGALKADEMVFFPPHDMPAGDGVIETGRQIAVMQRGGGFSFVKKALIAQEMGASALIVANTDDQLFRPGDPSGEGAGVAIPVWLIGAKDSTALQDGLRVEVSRLRTDLIAQDYEIVEKRTQSKSGAALRPSPVSGERDSRPPPASRERDEVGGRGRPQQRGARRTESLLGGETARGQGRRGVAGGKRRGGRAGSRAELDGVTLQDMVTWLSMDMGWEEMARKTGVKVFASNPSVKSSLKMLRQKDNEWARQKVEKLYRRSLDQRSLDL